MVGIQLYLFLIIWDMHKKAEVKATVFVSNFSKFGVFQSQFSIIWYSDLATLNWAIEDVPHLDTSPFSYQDAQQTQYFNKGST